MSGANFNFWRDRGAKSGSELSPAEIDRLCDLTLAGRPIDTEMTIMRARKVGENMRAIMNKINDTPNTPGTIGYDDTKPATVSGSNPGVPIDQAQRPDWAGGRQAYDIVNDTSVYRLTVHAAGETFTAMSVPGRVHTITREDATALLRKLADQIERAG